MGTGREIRSKIGSVKKTQKITRAMELVAASKMRKAQLQMAASRPYATKIRTVVSHVAKSHAEFPHPFLVPRASIKRVGFIVISSDRGLCGGLNVNLFKAVLQEMQAWQQKQASIDVCTIGTKAEHFFGRIGSRIIGKANHLGDTPNVMDLIGVVKVMLDAYSSNELDAVYLCFNEFINTMTQKPTIRQLLPIEITDEGTEKGYWDYIYEPEAKSLLTALLVRYIEMQVYQAVVENLACEQSARMVAMKSATDNAKTIIDELQLAYNKARQAAITQEIAEITAGAGAISWFVL